MSYYCTCCGMSYRSPQDVLLNNCNKSKTGRHVLYEGEEKSLYTCKYCGRQFRSIRDMTINVCQRNPSGGRMAPHVPAR